MGSKSCNICIMRSLCFFLMSVFLAAAHNCANASLWSLWRYSACTPDRGRQIRVQGDRRPRDDRTQDQDGPTTRRPAAAGLKFTETTGSRRDDATTLYRGRRGGLCAAAFNISPTGTLDASGSRVFKPARRRGLQQPRLGQLFLHDEHALDAEPPLHFHAREFVPECGVCSERFGTGNQELSTA